jgi:hypothetical protein
MSSSPQRKLCGDFLHLIDHVLFFDKNFLSAPHEGKEKLNPQRKKIQKNY